MPTKSPSSINTEADEINQGLHFSSPKPQTEPANMAPFKSLRRHSISGGEIESIESIEISAVSEPFESERLTINEPISPHKPTIDISDIRTRARQFMNKTRSLSEFSTLRSDYISSSKQKRDLLDRDELRLRFDNWYYEEQSASNNLQPLTNDNSIFQNIEISHQQKPRDFFYRQVVFSDGLMILVPSSTSISLPTTPTTFPAKPFIQRSRSAPELT